MCLVNIYLIETAREWFVSARCQTSPRGVTAYQLLIPCSVDSVAQSLQVYIYCNLEMARVMANNDASSATIRVLVSFFLVVTDIIFDLC